MATSEAVLRKDPPVVELTVQDGIGVVTLNRPAKRNAINDDLIQSLNHIFVTLSQDIKAVVIRGNGDCFCAGLDLSELTDQSITGGIRHSRLWHKTFDAIQFGDVPVISVLHGAVVGGGLELASATHIRVAEDNAFFALPEGQRGIFVGGGGSVRLPRLIGLQRVTDMMLTGRVMDAPEAERIGLAQYVTETGKGFELAMELAAKVAKNAPLTNFAVIHALPRTAEAAPEQAFMLESLMAAIAQGDDLAKERLRLFLDKKAAKVRG
jgi:enoyl-CoA hydratase/carnithine racemase